jgi:NAD(P)-dependent dehydrogenase (short-subunit alcohol dehydrogenase family)
VHAKATKPGIVCYATSKAALAGLTRSLAVDLGARIRVNSVNPAAVNTPMLVDGFRNGPEKLQLFARMHPLDRIAEPSEVANVVLFLASDRAAFMSGASIDVDGGIMARLHDPD